MLGNYKIRLTNNPGASMFSIHTNSSNSTSYIKHCNYISIIPDDHVWQYRLKKLNPPSNDNKIRIMSPESLFYNENGFHIKETNINEMGRRNGPFYGSRASKFGQLTTIIFLLSYSFTISSVLE